MKYLFSLIVFITIPILLVAENTYRVNTDSKLNVRSGPGTHYNIMYQLKSGSIVNLIEDYNNEWAKIESSGKIGFVKKEFIIKQISTQKQSSNQSISDWFSFKADYLLYAILALIIINFICLLFFDIDFVLPLSIYILPILIIVYIHLSPDPMWFCSPKSVGWFLTCINVFSTFIVLSWCCGIFIDSFKSIFRLDVLAMLIACLYGYTIYLIVITAITELTIFGILMIIGSAKSSSYVGTFTDRDGNMWDVFKE